MMIQTQTVQEKQTVNRHRNSTHRRKPAVKSVAGNGKHKLG
jgi:hypothetical protein